jgi:hypothetical protein
VIRSRRDSAVSPGRHAGATGAGFWWRGIAAGEIAPGSNARVAAAPFLSTSTVSAAGHRVGHPAAPCHIEGSPASRATEDLGLAAGGARRPVRALTNFLFSSRRQADPERGFR